MVSNQRYRYFDDSMIRVVIRSTSRSGAAFIAVPLRVSSQSVENAGEWLKSNPALRPTRRYASS